jgi:hypothetical protein
VSGLSNVIGAAVIDATPDDSDEEQTTPDQQEYKQQVNMTLTY